MENRRTKKTEKELEAIVEEYLDLENGLDANPDLAPVKGCCSMNSFYGFPSDEQINDEITNAKHKSEQGGHSIAQHRFEKVAKAQLKAWLDDVLECEENNCTFATVGEDQTLVKAALLELGFRQKDEYEGNDGIVYVLTKHL